VGPVSSFSLSFLLILPNPEVPLDIHSLGVETTSRGSEIITAVLAGRSLGYEISGAPGPVRRSYDPFLLAGFALAMESGGEIVVGGDGPVSRPLIANLDAAMGVYVQWFPGLNQVPVRAERVEESPEAGSDHVGCFFSGGVDSLYTFIENEAEITHLILCQGLDIRLGEPERWQKTVDFARRFADERGKGLVLVRTDAKGAARPPGRTDNHGAVLVSTGLGLGFRKLLVPGSHSLLELFPWGSHVLLDPLYSNGVSAVVHDSPMPRSSKTAVIARTGIGLDVLRVCNVLSDYNCGTCEKCMRTRTMLALVEANSPVLPALDDPRTLRRVKLYSDSQYSFWSDNCVFAESVGRKDIQREIERILRSFRIRRALRQLDQDLLGGAAARVKRKLRPATGGRN
jgi:hypothetical protein